MNSSSNIPASLCFVFACLLFKSANKRLFVCVFLDCLEIMIVARLANRGAQESNRERERKEVKFQVSARGYLLFHERIRIERRNIMVTLQHWTGHHHVGGCKVAVESERKMFKVCW